MRMRRVISGIMAAAMTMLAIPAGSVNAGEVLTQTGGGQLIGEEGGYSYELWQSNSGCGTSTMTLNDGATFDCQWDCSGSQGNFLARRGMRFDCTQTYKDIGNIAFDYDVDYNPSSKGSSYLCVYGWTREPLVEYYIVDNWKNWRPPNGAAAGQGDPIASVEIDGAMYDIYKSQRVQQPSIDGTQTFWQYWSVRQEPRSSGVINIANHFEVWESYGLEMGKFYEAALNIEGWESTGSAKITKNNVTLGTIKETEPTAATEPPTAPADGYYLQNDFETSAGQWTGRGDAETALSGTSASGDKGLAVTGRTDNWHGAAVSLSNKEYIPGTAYSFSVMAMQDAAASDEFKLTLQYTLDGKDHYDNIASATGEKGEWVQLANDAFTIPTGAADMILYVEADSKTNDFFIDDAAIAVKGTKISPSTGSKLLMGDVDKNSKVELLDIVNLQKHLLGLKATVSGDTADLNSDGVIDVFDLALLKRQLLQKKTESDTPAPVETPTESNDPTEPETEPVRREGYWYNKADVSWIDPSKPMVAFAFDDGPVSGGDNSSAGRIQTAISENGGHATFFYWGVTMDGNESEIKRAQSLGFEIANHTLTHTDLSTLDAAGIRKEIGDNAAKLTAITGETDFLVRPPYLGVNDTVKQNAGVPLICCGFDSGDWNGATTQQMIDKFTQGMQDGSLNGKIILMHETYDKTADAVENLAPYMKAQGWQIVSVSEMFKAKGVDMKNGEVYNYVP